MFVCNLATFPNTSLRLVESSKDTSGQVMRRRTLQVVLSVLALLCLNLHIHLVNAAGTALSKKAVNALCEAATGLKRVAPYADTMLGRAETAVDQMERKIFMLRASRGVNASWNESEGCPEPEKTFQELLKKEKHLRMELRQVRRAGLNATAYAAVSAGRLLEFAMAFIQAYGSTNDHCVSASAGTPADHSHLTGCFSETLSGSGSVTKIGEEWIPDVEAMWDQNENLDINEKDTINKVAGAQIGRAAEIAGETSSTNCPLTKGTQTSGLIGAGSSGLAKSFAWGGGVLVIGHRFAGDLASGFAIGDPSDGLHETNLNAAAKWTATPADKVLHLKKAAVAVRTFKDRVNEIIRETGKADTEIKKCFGETSLEGPEVSRTRLADIALRQIDKLHSSIAELGKEKMSLGKKVVGKEIFGGSKAGSDAVGSPLTTEVSHAHSKAEGYLVLCILWLNFLLL